MEQELGCWSCAKQRDAMTRCADKIPGFPTRGAGRCKGFVYEPGSDEAERPEVGGETVEGKIRAK